MISKRAKATFNYATRWSYILLRLALQRKNCKARVCYATTQQYRMYLAVDTAGINLVPCIRDNNQWCVTPLCERAKIVSTVDVFEGAEHLKDVMTEALFLQFPQAEECYYDELPSYSEMLQTLQVHPYASVLDSKFYLFIREANIRVEEADGIISILVSEGVYDVPYTEVMIRQNVDYYLQMDRGRLHPESWICYLNEKFWNGFDNLISLLRKINWGNFRRAVDNLIK